MTPIQLECNAQACLSICVGPAPWPAPPGSTADSDTSCRFTAGPGRPIFGPKHHLHSSSTWSPSFRVPGQTTICPSLLPHKACHQPLTGQKCAKAAASFTPPAPCTCRAAWVPLDPAWPQQQLLAVLQKLQPQVLLWAPASVSGGRGPPPAAHCPTGVRTVEVASGLLESRAMSQSGPWGSAPTQEAADPAGREDAAGALPQHAALVSAWQAATHGGAALPFCYVMLTSGTSGSPAAVCGTEQGAFVYSSCFLFTPCACT